MTVQHVRFYPAPVLSKQCEYVGDFDEKLLQLIEDLKDTAKQHGAHGIAAPQLGSAERVLVLLEGEEYKAFINPSIVESAVNQVQTNEGCLSFPQVYGIIPRAEWVKIRYQNTDGSFAEEIVLADSVAIAFQHELDHLNGVVFTSRMGKIDKHLSLKKHLKIQKRIGNNTKRLQAQLDKLGKGNIVTT